MEAATVAEVWEAVETAAEHPVAAVMARVVVAMAEAWVAAAAPEGRLLAALAGSSEEVGWAEAETVTDALGVAVLVVVALAAEATVAVD